MKELVLKRVITKPAVSYYFAFESYGSWACFTINESTGELNVQSDWGNWAYRWNVNALGAGVKLTQFLALCDADYVVRKLAHGGNTDLKETVSVEKTVQAVKKEVLYQRRQGSLSREEARELWDSIDDWVSAGFMPGMANMELQSFAGTHDLYRYEDSFTYTFLQRQLIPLFQQWLKENVCARPATV